jgi:biopolymer transport protein ExbD
LLALSAAIVLLAVSLSWYGGGASAQSDPPPPPPKGETPPPPPKGAAPPPPPKGQGQSGERLIRPLSVLLKSDGARIDGEMVGYDQLVEKLEIFGGRDPENVTVNLVCDDDVPMSDVRVFQETLLKLGISRISYVNGSGDHLPLQLPPQKAMDRLAEMPDEMLVDIYVGPGEGIRIGGRKVKTGSLTNVLKSVLEAQPMAIVVINNGSDTGYGDFTEVLKAVKAAGADRVVVKFDEAK